MSPLLACQESAAPPRTDDPQDVALWVRERDDAAFARLVQRHTALVTGICRRRLGASLADEAVQAVFIVLAHRADRIANPDCLGAWLHGVAVRICHKAIRTRSRRTKHERQAARMPPPPEADLAWNDLRPHLDAAIAVLSSSQRVAVVGHFLEGHTQSAVAARLGISEAAVHQRIHYALAKLRTWFARRGMAVGAGALLAGLAREVGTAEPALITASIQAIRDPASASAASALARSELGAGTLGGIGGIAGIITTLLVAMIVSAGVIGSSWLASPSAADLPSIKPAESQRLLLDEPFDDPAFSERGWYDQPTFRVATIAEHAADNPAAEFRFAAGASTPQCGGNHRRLFPPATAIRIRYRIRFGPGWETAPPAGRMGYVWLMTTRDDPWVSPAASHLTCAIGLDHGVPYVSLQDPLNIAADHLGADLTGLTEDRAVAGGNGDSDAYPGSWYRRADGTPANLKSFALPAAIPSPHAEPGSWHHIEVAVHLNRIVDGRGVADGRLSYRIDGRTVLDLNDVLLRTGRHADRRFNQIVVSPWMERAERECTFWIDDLTVTSDADLTNPEESP